MGATRDLRERGEQVLTALLETPAIIRYPMAIIRCGISSLMAGRAVREGRVGLPMMVLKVEPAAKAVTARTATAHRAEPEMAAKAAEAEPGVEVEPGAEEARAAMATTVAL